MEEISPYILWDVVKAAERGQTNYIISSAENMLEELHQSKIA